MLTPQFKKTLLLAVITTLTTTSAQALDWFGKKSMETAKQQEVKQEALTQILNAPLTIDQENMQREALKALAAVMVPRLTEIQKKLNEENSQEALTLAKATLDDVRIKTGIDPKAKLRENFLVPITFPEGATQMSSLTLAQQELVIRTVKDFRGGLYLDILNLSKRTSLLYVKAFHQEVKKDGGVNIEDRNKIIKDLAIASVVPMPIQDKAGNIITVFDDEVANEDHIYLFNREIKSYLLGSKDLNIDEAGFIKYRSDMKSQILPVKAPTIPKNTGYQDGLACIARAGTISEYSVKTSAQTSCFNKYYKNTTYMNQCTELANSINEYSVKTSAQTACFNLYNK